MTAIAYTSSQRATWIGASSVLNWATLAALTQLAGPVPPFLLTGLCFLLAAGCAFAVLLWQGADLRAALRQPPLAWLLGVGGLFGFHLLYFIAQQNAPAANAGLISYLWPLLIVLFSAWLPGERLRGRQVAGALLGLGGAVLLIGPQGWSGAHAGGYLAAFAAALVWAGYSVLSRLFAAVPTSAMAWYCLLTGLLALLCHGVWEADYRPGGSQWLGVLLLGLGPVGSAFFTWDLGMKRGDLRLLGILAYATPLLSTLLLVLTGYATASVTLLMAAILIGGGALLGRSQARGVSRDGA